MENKREHWILRVGDGINFKNSKFSFWGVKRGKYGGIKTVVKKLKKGDILWFLTSKKFGGKLIGMAEYVGYYDREDEPLLKINTLTNMEQKWIGGEKWDLQLHYTNLYDTEKQNITFTIICGGIILNYNTFKEKIHHNLYNHYDNYIFYAEPKKINSLI